MPKAALGLKEKATHTPHCSESWGAEKPGGGPATAQGQGTEAAGRGTGTTGARAVGRVGCPLGRGAGSGLGAQAPLPTQDAERRGWVESQRQEGASMRLAGPCP